MTITAVKIGTTEYRYADKVAPGEVEFLGPIIYGENYVLEMVWDDALKNMRAWTDGERLAAENYRLCAKVDEEHARQREKTPVVDIVIAAISAISPDGINGAVASNKAIVQKFSQLAANAQSLKDAILSGERPDITAGW